MTGETRAFTPLAHDERLSIVADCFPCCQTGADIGADHGKLSLMLLASGRCQRMIVSDLSAASLAKARSLLKRKGLSDRADFVVADGLLAITQPVEAIAICGLGGRRMAAMLKDAVRAGQAKLILSAHSSMPELRQALLEAGYRIPEERVLRSGSRFYTVICAARGRAAYSERQLYIGPSLTATVSARVGEYLRWRLAAAVRERGPEGERHVLWLKEALKDAYRNR